MTEVVQLADAQRRAERIRFHATNANEAMTALRELVNTAREMDDHLTLGYPSWTAYLRDLFGDEPLRLARDVRQELVAELSAQGMSTRAIAPIIGVSQRTVANDVSNIAQVPAAVANDTPDPAATLADLPGSFELDGMTVTRSGEVLDSTPSVTEHTVTEKVKTVTGLDGKEYKRPAPHAPRAEPITPQFTSAIADLNRVMAKLHRISQDKNFARNKEQVASLHASDLSRTISELETLAELIS